MLDAAAQSHSRYAADYRGILSLWFSFVCLFCSFFKSNSRKIEADGLDTTQHDSTPKSNQEALGTEETLRENDAI